MLDEWDKEDGLHDIEWDKYHTINAVRSSWLEAMRRSPAACKYVMDSSDPSKETPSLRMGRALHAAVLEPLSFSERFKALEHPGNTKAGKKEREGLDGATGLNATEWQSVTAMAKSLQTHPRVAGLVSQATMMEKSIIWTRDGRRCKARPDIGAKTWLADCKTVTQLKRFSPYQITDYGYHRQAAWYLSAYQFLGLPIPEHYYYLVVASTPPHESAVFRLNVEAVSTGIDETTKLFEQFLHCEKDHTWTQHEENLLTATSFPPRQVGTMSSE